MSVIRNLTTATAVLAVGIVTGASLSIADDYKIVYVMSDNLGDKGFNDSAAEGFRRLEEEGVTIKFLQASPTDPQLWRQNLDAVSEAGDWDIIFTGPNMHDNLAEVAPQYPDQKYVFFDDQLELPNVLSVKYAQNDGSYLAGALAGLATTDTESFPLSKGAKKVGLVAGMDIPVIQDFIVGFKQGVAAIDPAIEVQVAFIGNFNDAQKAYDLTTNVFNDGADIVYNVAGPAGLGILKAAADADKYGIGVDNDQNGLHPDNIAASMLKQIGNSLYDSVHQIQSGEAPFGELVIYGLTNDGVGLVYNDALVPQSVKDAVDAQKQKVVSGEVMVDTVLK